MALTTASPDVYAPDSASLVFLGIPKLHVLYYRTHVGGLIRVYIPGRKDGGYRFLRKSSYSEFSSLGYNLPGGIRACAAYYVQCMSILMSAGNVESVLSMLTKRDCGSCSLTGWGSQLCLEVMHVDATTPNKPACRVGSPAPS